MTPAEPVAIEFLRRLAQDTRPELAAQAGRLLASLGELTDSERPTSADRVGAGLEAAASITARLAHDFGNILTGILGFAELALDALPPQSQTHEYLKEVHESAQRGATLVQKLRVFSRKTAPAFRPTLVQRLIAEEKRRFDRTWGDDALVVNVAADVPQVAVDAESLRHLLTQLLENAHEAGAEGNQVSLSVRTCTIGDADCRGLIGAARPGAFVEITVSDTGHGMSDDVRARLFHEPFFSTKPCRRGFGLAMIFGIVRTFGGGLRIDPPAESGTTDRSTTDRGATVHGTTVCVYLPIARPAPAQFGAISDSVLSGGRPPLDSCSR